MTVEEDCPLCSDSDSAKEQFATAKVAEHIKEKGAHDDEHQQWLDDKTEDGTLPEIRSALRDESPSR